MDHPPLIYSVIVKDTNLKNVFSSKMKWVPNSVDKLIEASDQFTMDEKPDMRLDIITMVALAAAVKAINKKIEELKVMRINKKK